MSQMPQDSNVVQVKPESNVFTALMAVAIVALIVSVVIVTRHLMVDYGLSFGDLLKPLAEPR